MWFLWKLVKIGSIHSQPILIQRKKKLLTLSAAHIKFFEMWLNEKKKIITKGLFLFTFNYWHHSFKHNLNPLCFHHYKFVPGGDNQSSSFTKSSNSMLKWDPMGPKPLMAIDWSQIVIVDHKLSCIFPGNSRGTGKFSQFWREPLP